MFHSTLLHEKRKGEGRGRRGGGGGKRSSFSCVGGKEERMTHQQGIQFGGHGQTGSSRPTVYLFPASFFNTLVDFFRASSVVHHVHV